MRYLCLKDGKPLSSPERSGEMLAGASLAASDIWVFQSLNSCTEMNVCAINGAEPPCSGGSSSSGGSGGFSAVS
jgi:hypothetical protein